MMQELCFVVIFVVKRTNTCISVRCFIVNPIFRNDKNECGEIIISFNK